ncbi:MAG: hypothetical protein ACI8SR_000639 [Oceanicoccus sp.]|jgi:hypothetical protein
MIFNSTKPFATLIATILLSACGSDSSNTQVDNSCKDDEFNFAIQTVSPNNRASSVALGCSTTGNLTDSLLIKSDSDYTVSSGSDSFYHIGRDEIDTIAKYQFSTSSLQDWEFSSNNANEAGSSNPHKVVEVSSTKAYIIRYGKSDIWIIDPSATDESSFKIGTIDLSHYLGDGETTVNMTDAIISNGHLFVAMQRIGANYIFSNDSKIAVFNTETDIEVDSTPNNANDEKAITLLGKNVQSITSKDNSVFIASRGNYGDDYGLLEVINTSNYALTTVIAGSSEVGHITDVAAISSSRIYVLGDFSGYADGAYTYKQNVMDINVDTKTVTTEITKLKGTHISDIELGPEGNLWIASSISSNPGIYKIDPSTNTEIAFIETISNPNKIVFKQ